MHLMNYISILFFFKLNSCLGNTMSLSQDGRNNLILLVVVNFERLPSLTLETLLIDTIAQITTQKKKKKKKSIKV